jgi:hypothetical protein
VFFLSHYGNGFPADAVLNMDVATAADYAKQLKKVLDDRNRAQQEAIDRHNARQRSEAARARVRRR